VKVLATGGAGYVGSVVTEALILAGHDVTVLDDFSKGHREAIHTAARWVGCDLTDRAAAMEAVVEAEPELVVHLAAETTIDESTRDPGRFFLKNVGGGINLLDAMVVAGARGIIFSSTAATYGEPRVLPIPEGAPTQPVNSYGESKLAFERILPWYESAHGIKHISLRYFNACGATDLFGEDHRPETHILPLLLQTVDGKRDAFRLFGDDYDTPDGTCVRDYVHVSDIAEAHLLALGRLDGVKSRIFNIGSGEGFTNLQVIETVREVTGREVKVARAQRRPGDPSRLVATSELVRAELGWSPRYPDIGEIVDSAWRWHLKHPEGYSA